MSTWSVEAEANFPGSISFAHIGLSLPSGALPSVLGGMRRKEMGSNSSKDLNQKWTEPGLCGSLGKTETAGIGTNLETVRMKSGQHCFGGSFMCGAKGLPLLTS